MVKQDSIVCTYLKQNLILGIHFTHLNCTSIEWTKEGTRILTLKGRTIIEVKEDELRIPVSVHKNIPIPLRTGGVIYIDVNARFDTNQVLIPHTPYFEEMPMVYPHEIVIPLVRNESDKFMHIIHITNVGTDESW